MRSPRPAAACRWMTIRVTELGLLEPCFISWGRVLRTEVRLVLCLTCRGGVWARIKYFQNCEVCLRSWSWGQNKLHHTPTYPASSTSILAPQSPKAHRL